MADRLVLSRAVLEQRRKASGEGHPPITETIRARGLCQKARNIITGNWLPDSDPKRLIFTSEGSIDHEVIEAAQEMISAGFHFEIRFPHHPANGYQKHGIDCEHELRHPAGSYNYYPAGTCFTAPEELIEAARNRLKQESARTV